MKWWIVITPTWTPFWGWCAPDVWYIYVSNLIIVNASFVVFCGTESVNVLQKSLCDMITKAPLQTVQWTNMVSQSFVHDGGCMTTAAIRLRAVMAPSVWTHRLSIPSFSLQNLWKQWRSRSLASHRGKPRVRLQMLMQVLKMRMKMMASSRLALFSGSPCNHHCEIYCNKAWFSAKYGQLCLLDVYIQQVWLGLLAVYMQQVWSGLLVTCLYWTSVVKFVC